MREAHDLLTALGPTCRAGTAPSTQSPDLGKPETSELCPNCTPREPLSSRTSGQVTKDTYEGEDVRGVRLHNVVRREALERHDGDRINHEKQRDARDGRWSGLPPTCFLADIGGSVPAGVKEIASSTPEISALKPPAPLIVNHELVR